MRLDRVGTVLFCSLLAACGGSPPPTDTDAAEVDAGVDAARTLDAGRDAFADDAFVIDAGGPEPIDAGNDASLDAGPTGLVLDSPPMVVDDCTGNPQLTWNGEGWGLWWDDCISDGPGHLRELDEAGRPGALVTYPPLPPEAGTTPVWPDSLIFANGRYAFGGRVWFGGETPSIGPYVATMDRSGSGTPWVRVDHAFSVLIGGGDGTPGWWTEEYGAPEGTRLALRDASMTERSRSTLSTAAGVGRAQGRTHDLLWDGTIPMRLIEPDGALSPISDTTPLAVVRGFAWDDAFLLETRSDDPMGFDLVVLDPATAADTRAHVALQGSGVYPMVAPIPEQDRAALCWSRTELQPEGYYAVAFYLQLVDLAAGTVLGAPTLVSLEGNAPHFPTCGWSGSHVIVVWSPLGDTRVASYRVVP